MWSMWNGLFCCRVENEYRNNIKLLGNLSLGWLLMCAQKCLSFHSLIMFNSAQVEIWMVTNITLSSHQHHLHTVKYLHSNKMSQLHLQQWGWVQPIESKLKKITIWFHSLGVQTVQHESMVIEDRLWVILASRREEFDWEEIVHKMWGCWDHCAFLFGSQSATLWKLQCMKVTFHTCSEMQMDWNSVQLRKFRKLCSYIYGIQSNSEEVGRSERY